MNSLLDLIANWGNENQLAFNPKKTQAMLISGRRKHSQPFLKMSGEKITVSKSIQYFGLHFSDNLIFDKHFLYTKMKFKSLTNAISVLMKFEKEIDLELRTKCYNALVESVVNYGASVWSSQLQLDKVKKLFKQIEMSWACKSIRAYRTSKYEDAMLLSALSVSAEKRTWSYGLR